MFYFIKIVLFQATYLLSMVIFTSEDPHSSILFKLHKYTASAKGPLSNLEMEITLNIHIIKAKINIVRKLPDSSWQRESISVPEKELNFIKNLLHSGSNKIRKKKTNTKVHVRGLRYRIFLLEQTEVINKTTTITPPKNTRAKKQKNHEDIISLKFVAVRTAEDKRQPAIERGLAARDLIDRITKLVNINGIIK